MLTPEDHAKLLRSFEVDRLLKLVTLEAKRVHGGRFAIFAFTSGYKVAFGIPEINPPGCRQQAYAQLCEMSHASTLKEALIAALVSGKAFDDYFDGDPEAWFHAHIDRDPNVRALFTMCEAIAIKKQARQAGRTTYYKGADALGSCSL